jgi:type I restriction enzyme, S subunit
MKALPLSPLKCILNRSLKPAEINPEETYKQVTVRLFHKGIVTRCQQPGSAISSRQWFVRKGQVLLSRIDARNGAIGLVPAELDGAIVTNDFWAFDVNNDVAEPRFLDFYFGTKQFVENCQRASEGTTNRVRIQPDRFLQIEVPLPPVPEQCRIIARIEELSAKIEEGSGLRKSSAFEAEAIFQSALHSIWQNQSGWATAEIGDLIKTVSGQVNPTIEPFAGMPHINGESMESNTGRLLNNFRLAKVDGVTSGKYHFRAGAILYSKIRPYLRKAVIVPFEGICSADVYATESIDARVDSRFLKYTLIGADFTAYANEKSGRTRMPKLNQKQLFAYRMTYPSLEEQRRIVAYLDDLQAKVDSVKKLQEESKTELNALMPSILSKAFAGEL